MERSNIGLIGLAVMGQNLALNIESRGYYITVFNRTSEKTKEFMEGPAKGKDRITDAYTIDEFVKSLKSPRKIIIMVKAGEAVDKVINSLIPHLNKGDIIIDGGNSYFRDTIRRSRELKEKDILFLGTGISGGEEGALKGPSIMPGGSFEAWNEVADILEGISAKVEGNIPCCSFIGPDGAGHFVKMVHNGIEYGDMQLISETYFIMKELLNMTPSEMQDVYSKWNNGELNSYLIEITADIMGKIDDETGKPLVDVILDSAKEKGTGKWTSREAMELCVAAPTITEALYARYMSSKEEERVEASKVINCPKISVIEDRESIIEDLGKALYASKICSYAQGFALLKQASRDYKWDLDMGSIALLWRGGCIIRAQFLNMIKNAYDNDRNLQNLLIDPYFNKAIEGSLTSWRKIISLAVLNGIPVPSLSSALSYYDSYRRDRLPANIIQAQRDYFGSHTYERIDKEGVFHTEWKKLD